MMSNMLKAAIKAYSLEHGLYTSLTIYDDTEAKQKAIEQTVGSDATPDIVSEPYTVIDEELIKKLNGL